MSDDDVWQVYAKSVKKIDKKSNSKRRTVPSPSRGGLGGALRNTEALKLLKNKKHTQSLSPLPNPPHKGEGMLTVNPAQNKLDRRAEKNLRLGDITLDARIDLHGMTQPEAHDALTRFMATQVKTEKRNLLIITGKGRGGDGVLRANLAGWLQALPEARQILGLRPAAPKHGGNGAFYVLLKKKKPT